MSISTGAESLPTPDAAVIVTLESLIVTPRPLMLGWTFVPTMVAPESAESLRALLSSFLVQAEFIVRAAVWSAVAVYENAPR